MRLPVIAVIVVLFCAQIVGAIPLIGQVDDFEDGTTMSWTGGSTSYTNIPDGGPDGTGDNFLEVVQATTFRKLAAYNSQPRWKGNYQSAGVTALTVAMMTTDSTPLEMRAVLFGGGFIQSADRWTSTNAAVLPNDGSWHALTFSLLESDLTQVVGSSSFNNTITGVERIMLRHQSGIPLLGGTNIAATVNIDNISIALPCDFNSDNNCNATDIDLLAAAVRNITRDAQFNVDGQGPNVPDNADFDFYITDDSMLGTGLGDHDLNMIVNFSDFVKLSNNFGMTGTGWNQGNGNTDDITNFNDFVRLSNNFGMNFASESKVPEPMAALLLGMGGLALVHRGGIWSQTEEPDDSIRHVRICGGLGG